MFKTMNKTSQFLTAAALLAIATAYSSSVGLQAQTLDPWVTMDNFQNTAGLLAVSADDSAGNLFVCGRVLDSSGSSHWLVRKGTTVVNLVKQGKKWVQVSTVVWANSDVFQLAPNRAAMGLDLNRDNSGNMFVCGNAADATGVDHWIVRKLAK